MCALFIYNPSGNFFFPALVTALLFEFVLDLFVFAFSLRTGATWHNVSCSTFGAKLDAPNERRKAHRISVETFNASQNDLGDHRQHLAYHRSLSQRSDLGIGRASGLELLPNILAIGLIT
jgi:hypothetical protein